MLVFKVSHGFPNCVAERVSQSGQGFLINRCPGLSHFFDGPNKMCVCVYLLTLHHEVFFLFLWLDPQVWQNRVSLGVLRQRVQTTCLQTLGTLAVHYFSRTHVASDSFLSSVSVRRHRVGKTWINCVWHDVSSTVSVLLCFFEGLS